MSINLCSKWLCRKHRHVNNQIHCLLFQASMSYSFWADASLFGVHLINITPLIILNFMSPYENCMVNHLITFCLRFWGVYVFLMLQGFKCLDPSTNKIILFRHVNFQESFFPYSSMFPVNPSPLTIPSSQTTPPIFSPVQFPNMCVSPITNFDFISMSDPTSSPSISMSPKNMSTFSYVS